MLKQWKRGSLAEAMLTLLAGILVLAFPQQTRAIMCAVLAVAVIVFGLYRIIVYFRTPVGQPSGYGLAFGLCLLAAGICAFIWRDEVVGFLSAVLALAILVQGAAAVQSAVDLLRIHQPGWWCMLLLAAIDIGFGIAVLAYYEQGFVWMLVGIGMITSAVLRTAATIWIGRGSREREGEE